MSQRELAALALEAKFLDGSTETNNIIVAAHRHYTSRECNARTAKQSYLLCNNHQCHIDAPFLELHSITGPQPVTVMLCFMSLGNTCICMVV